MNKINKGDLIRVKKTHPLYERIIKGLKEWAEVIEVNDNVYKVKHIYLENEGTKAYSLIDDIEYYEVKSKQISIFDELI